MTYLPRVVRNTATLFISRTFISVINFIVGVYMARYLGATLLGEYSTVFAYIAFFSIFTFASGIDHVLVREVSNSGNEEEIRKKIATAIALRMGLGAIGFILAIAISSLLYGGTNIHCYIFLSSFSLLFAYYENNSPFTVHYNVKLNLLVPQLITLALSVASTMLKLLFIFGLRAPVLAFILLDSGILVAISLAYMILYFRKWGSPFRRADISLNDMKYLAKESAPIFLSQIFVMIYLRIDQIILSKWHGSEPLGYYSIAVQLSEAFNFIPMYLAVSLLPVFTRTAGEGNVDEIYGLSFRFLNMFIFPVILFCSLFSEQLVGILFGPQFGQASQSLRILVWSEFFLFGGVMYSTILLARGLQRHSMMMYIVQAATNVILNLLLQRNYSIIGASWASVISYGAGFLVSALLTDLRKLLIIYVDATIRFLVVSLLVYFSGHFLPIMGKIIVFLIGVIVLFCASMKKNDIAMIGKIRDEMMLVGKPAD